MRPRSLHWHAAIALAGVVVILLAGAIIILNLIHQPVFDGGSAHDLRIAPMRAVRVLGTLILITAVFLAGIFLWIRRRILGELDRLVELVEEEDPDRPGRRTLPAMEVSEFERLRLAFSRFLERFDASRARQEEVEGTLGSVIEHAADAILVLDGQHRLVSWNRGAEETFDFPAEDMVGQPYANLVPLGAEEPGLRAALAPGSTVKDFRTRRLRRDGSIIDVSLTRSRIPAPEGEDERFVEILRDISATRRLEEELIRTEKMAAVGKISSKVVHEIRNPLASINLNVDLLKDSLKAHPSDPEAEEILGTIKREVRRLSQITDEYLQFSRLPLAVFRRERVNDILIELSDFVGPSIRRKGIRLVLNLDEDDPEAVCDATLIRQALLNLLRNAVDATEEGQGRIQIGTRAVQADEAGFGGGDPVFDAVEISVEDNGRGIPEDQISRIFEPFFTTKKDGTGLGLALVSRAVEEHQGRILCASVPGRGTRFRVLLPVQPPSAAGASAEEPPEPGFGAATD